jgi:hypothetical protein
MFTQDDFDVWKANCGAHPGNGAAAAIPEPASALLLLTALFILLTSSFAFLLQLLLVFE